MCEWYYVCMCVERERERENIFENSELVSGKNERRVGNEKEGKMIFYLSTYKKQENALQIL